MRAETTYSLPGIAGKAPGSVSTAVDPPRVGSRKLYEPDDACAEEYPGSFQNGKPSRAGAGGPGFPLIQPGGNATITPSGVIRSSKSKNAGTRLAPGGRSHPDPWPGEPSSIPPTLRASLDAAVPDAGSSSIGSPPASSGGVQ